jgi:hypothetical protein
MLNEDFLSQGPVMPDPSTMADVQPRPAQGPLNARLTDPDRRAVDFVLDGDSSASQEMTSPAGSASFMERVNSVRQLLNVLESLPAEEPPTNLVAATLNQVLATPPASPNP